MSVRQVYDVVIIGAGPAGCAAARTLAKANLSVGCSTRPSSHGTKFAAMRSSLTHTMRWKNSGLLERVTRIAFPAQGMRLIGFDGSNVLVRAVSACVPRLKLDELLVKSSVEVGAEFLPGHELVNVVNEDAKNYRVEFSSTAPILVAARAQWVLLATGRQSDQFSRRVYCFSREQKLCASPVRP